jgi:hypothetical protein
MRETGAVVVGTGSSGRAPTSALRRRGVPVRGFLART